MAVYVCKRCKALEPDDETHNKENYCTFTDGDFAATGVSCAHCGSPDLECDHPSGQFDRARQSFVCSSCGAEYGNNETFVRLRGLAKTGEIPELCDLIDCTDH